MSQPERKISEIRQTGFLHHAELIKLAKPADLLEFDRGLYKHWALYAGGGMVINVCGEDCNKTEAWVRLQPIQYVCDLHPVPRYRLVRINNTPDVPGCLLRPTPRLPDRAMEEARLMLDTKVPYEYEGRNSEFYCNLWKFGRIFSEEAMKAGKNGII
ncbi:phospholipase A and acyltransferase 1 [Folsomia candida]|uniref:Phospholipid-metabolizing enzyme A-C1 n=1 Tax=Folsomia candida TaxID=158441 RepID=A0A226DJJ2_FOLCA|nr:phospholipase A and acyltransferase 1 [Folsomia candida]OXA45369.1 Phospholipid-metabolizing enzyme A-C1 [Folsomia candida]